MDEDVHIWVERIVSHPDRMLRLLGVLTVEEMRRFADGTLMIAVMIDHEFERRFPAEYEAWVRENED